MRSRLVVVTATSLFALWAGAGSPRAQEGRPTVMVVDFGVGVGWASASELVTDWLVARLREDGRCASSPSPRPGQLWRPRGWTRGGYWTCMALEAVGQFVSRARPALRPKPGRAQRAQLVPAPTVGGRERPQVVFQRGNQEVWVEREIPGFDPSQDFGLEVTFLMQRRGGAAWIRGFT